MKIITVCFAVIFVLFISACIYASEITVEKADISLSPRLQFILPNGVVDAHFKENISRLNIYYKSRYVFLNGSNNNTLGFGYDFGAPFLGVEFNDRMSLGEVFFGEECIQRVHYVKPYFNYSLTKKLKLNTAIGFENTYTSSIDTSAVLDIGKNVVTSAGIVYDGIVETNAMQKGTRISFDVRGTCPWLGSNYEYMQGEVNIRNFWWLLSTMPLKIDLRFGYPIHIENKPLTSLYHAGGYSILRGYGYQEFRGNSLLYGMASYHIPFIKKMKSNFLRTEVEIATVDFFGEFANIADQNAFISGQGLKFSVGCGVGFSVTFF